jgi:hypothetical protein
MDTSVETDNADTHVDVSRCCSIIDKSSLEGCEFLNKCMQCFYELEHHQLSLGFSSLIRNAFNVIADTSEFMQEEISSHLKICRLCVNSTRSQVEGIGSLLNKSDNFLC